MHLSSVAVIGFPGETDAHFEETYRFIQDLNFILAFICSKRPGTPASELPDSTPEDEKRAFGKVQHWIKQSKLQKQILVLGAVNDMMKMYQ